MPENHQQLKIDETTYTIVRDLGGGLFHESWLVDDGVSKFVLKLFHNSYSAEFDRLASVWQEARIEGSEDLVGYQSWGVFDDRRYLLRRWIEAEPFNSFARRRILDPRDPSAGIAVGQAICRNVASRGLVHGRLTNSNIFFGAEGAPILVDPLFGAPTASTLLLSTQRPGWRGNVAPEQYRAGGATDKRTDVWLLGLLLSRLYSGKPDLVANQRILIELRSANLPMNLIKVLWHSLQEESSGRFADADTLATALAEITLAEHQRTVYVRQTLPEAIGPRPVISPTIRNIAIFALTIAIVGGLSWLFRHHSYKPAGRTIQAVPRETATPKFAPSVEITPEITPTPHAIDPRTLRPLFILETNVGKIEIEAYGDYAPIATLNFARHVLAGSYDGVAFDRVVPNFVIQAGQFAMNGERKTSPLPRVRNEWLNGGEATEGTIGMSRLASDPDTIQTTFFINLADNRRVFGTKKDGTGEAIFARVISGMDVVRSISNSKTRNPGAGDYWPQPAIYITSAYIGQGFEVPAVMAALEERQPKPRQLANGVIIEEVVVGRGRTYEQAKSITVHYVAKLENGTKVGSSRDQGQPITLRTGTYSANMVAGMEGMRIGGRRIITIPSIMGTPDFGIQGVPSSSRIQYDIHLISQQ